MKKKLCAQGGFTLLEVLVSMLILTFLVIGMGTPMKTALSIYRESTFQSSSASLTGTINATLADILRYAENVNTEYDAGGFSFTNTEYGLQDARFKTWGRNAAPEKAVLCFVDGNPILPDGSYPNLELAQFSITWDGECFRYTYTIQSTLDESLFREVSGAIAPVNSG